MTEHDSGTPGRDGESTQSWGDDYRAQLASMLSGTSAEDREAVASLPSGSAILVVRRGPNVGARFLLDQDSTIAGRHPDADIFLDDVTVSRRHAEFSRTGTQFELRDLGSLNGTYHDGERVDHVALRDGAEVQVGKFRPTFYRSRLDLEPRA